MKNLNCILGPMAVVLGLGLSESLVVEAQGTPPKVPVAGAGSPAGPGQTPAPLVIWDSQTAGGAQVGAWGNGSAKSSAGRNGTTLTATTRNFEEGIRFDLKKPIDIAPYRSAGWWRLRVQLGGAQRVGNRGRGGNNAPASLGGPEAPLTQLRVKLMLDNGAMSGLISLPQPDDRNRRRGNAGQSLLLAVRNMSATRGASGLVRRIILTGDSTASFDIEQVALVAETNRITATVRRSIDPVGTDISDITLKPGRSATLVADANGGTSDLNVLWNFNADNNPAFPLSNAPGAGVGTPGGRNRGDRNQGNQPGAPGAPARRVDAIGASARPNWPNEENDYRVEVTITDRAGKKPAVKKSFVVRVRA